jgi:hypothetical protein
MARTLSKQGESLVVPIKVLWAQAEPATSNLQANQASRARAFRRDNGSSSSCDAPKANGIFKGVDLRGRCRGLAARD